MKKLSAFVLLLCSYNAVADHNSWIGPAIIGGALAYGLTARPAPMYPVYAPQPPIYPQEYPGYHKEYIYQPFCNCYRLSLVLN